MKYKYILVFYLITLSIFFLNCDNITKPDTSPPTVTIISPQDNSHVSEIIDIHCEASDNKGISAVELWIDGDSTEIRDSTEKYILKWNTIKYIDESSHSILVRAYDINKNMADSEPITLVVNNSDCHPQAINILSIVFQNGCFIIKWNKSIDDDFYSYNLEKSLESEFTDHEIVFSTDQITDTTFVDTEVDPLIYQYYRICITDTVGLESKGQIISSTLDPVPNPVDITSVSYTLEEMKIEWQKSIDTDFAFYQLLHSVNKSDNKDTLVTIYDKDQVQFSITEFDPTHENWFWILVSDTLEQKTLGQELSNSVDLPPVPSNLYIQKIGSCDFKLSWIKNTDSDFKKYVLYESFSESMFNEQLIFETFDINDTVYTITGFGISEKRYYQLEVVDYWELNSKSTIVSGNTYNSGLKINEIYSVGPPNNFFYFYDQFIELYNSSADTVYLDGIIVCRMGYFLEQATYIFQFPGEPLVGREYPVPPDSFVVLAQDAYDHTNIPNCPLPESVDLSRADWEFRNSMDYGDIDNPDVPNLDNIEVGYSMDFLINLVNDVVLIADGSDSNYLDGIDINSVIDCVEYHADSDHLKEIEAELDQGFAGVGNTKYSGQSIERISPGYDTNNSTVDFEIIPRPTPGSGH